MREIALPRPPLPPATIAAPGGKAGRISSAIIPSPAQRRRAERGKTRAAGAAAPPPHDRGPRRESGPHLISHHSPPGIPVSRPWAPCPWSVIPREPLVAADRHRTIAAIDFRFRP